MAGLLDWLSKQKDSAMSDYAGLMDNYPNAQKFGSGLINNISQHIPSNADFKSPEAMRDWGTAAALNAPMGLAVSGYGNAKQIGDILDKKYGSKIDADISGSNKGLTLDKILIEKENRNQGLGSSFLKDLTQYADSSQQPMSLTAAGDFGGSKAKQIDLYKRFGFVENKGKNKDYSISNNMYRNPTQEQIINPNLNFELLNKHLSGQKLTPEEMALYEKNGSAMETPQLQRYNVENANANPEMEAYKNSLYDSFHGGRESKKYDGTIESAINGFDLSKGGMGSGNRDGKLGVFSTNDPFVASEFAEKRNNPFVMPLKIRMDNPWQPENYKEISDLIDNHTQFKDSYKFPDGSNIRMVGDVINPEAARKELTDKGFDSVRLKNTLMDSIEGKPIDQYVSLDPKNIRSRFAAFDPLRKNSSSLLASGLLGSLLLNNLGKDGNAATQ